MVISFFILALVFITTHIFPYFGGVKAINLATGGLKILDSSPVFSDGEVYHRLEAFGEIGREMYQRLTYTSDVVFPFSFLVFLFFLGRFVIQNSSGGRVSTLILYTMPVVWFLADIIENVIVYLVLDSYPQQLVIAGVLGYVTITKFILLGLSLLAPLTLWLYSSLYRIKP